GMPPARDGMPPPGSGMPEDGNGMPHKAGDMPSRPLTGKPHFPCSHPPNRPGPAYDHRPAAGPGRASRRARPRTADRQQEVRVILPDEPPALTPAAARALLRILLKAQPAAGGHERREHP
ncbi:MAG: hypothetical protein ACRDNF_19385, partial [Streptosporangiaceae bacterium]